MADQTITQTTIPDWAQGYFTGDKGIFTQAQALASRKYQPYETVEGVPIERQAGFSGLTQQAMQDAYNMAPSAAGIQAQGIAGAAGLNALNTQYDPTQVSVNQLQTGSFTQPGAAQAYMNPYMQSVVDIQKREAQRAADIAATSRGAQAVKAGAFGGSRQGVMDAEAQRNLALQMGDIQAQGSQSAYNQAMQQFNAEQQLGLTAQQANQQAGLDAQKLIEQSRQYGAGLGMQGLQTALTGASQLGTLGQQEFTQGMDINKLMAGYGAQQQAQQQAALDMQYQDFLTQQQFPYQQLGFYSDVLGTGLRGASGVTGQASTIYNAPPSTTSQLLGLGTAALGAYGAFGKAKGGSVGYAEGGSVEGYATGGIAGLNPMELDAATDRMSDRQMQGAMGLASITDLAKLQIAQKLAQNNQIRQAAMRAQAAQQPQPQRTVADETLAELGIGGLDVPEETFNAAGGGIVAFARGGDTLRSLEGKLGIPYGTKSESEQAADEKEAADRAKQKKRSLAAAEVKARQITDPQPAGDYKGLSSLVSQYANIGDAPIAAAKKATKEAGEASIDAEEKYVAAVKREQADLGVRGKEEEEAIAAEKEATKGAEDKNLNMSLIKAGLAIMSGTSKYAMENIGKGAMAGFESYEKGAERIQARKDKLQEALNKLNDARFSDKKENAKEVRLAERGVVTAKNQLAKDLAGVEVSGAEIGANNARAAVDAQVKIAAQQLSDQNAMARVQAQKSALDLAGQRAYADFLRKNPEATPDEQLAFIAELSGATYAGAAVAERKAGIQEIKAVEDDPLVKSLSAQLGLLKESSPRYAEIKRRLEEARKAATARIGGTSTGGGAGGGAGGKVLNFNDI